MSWRDWLAGVAAEARSTSRLRATRVVPAGCVDVSSNDYLGLSTNPAVRDAAAAALAQHGLGRRGSPLVSGYTDLHAELESALARLKGTEAALLLPSGFAANLAVLGALADDDLTIFSDQLNHASIVDGCGAARRRGASLVVYPHRDLEELERLLERHPAPRQLIVTDSVFSMDGDFAPLDRIVALAERFGAWVAIDEAHATLVHGPGGAGLAAHFGVTDGVQLHVGTLSKAFGAHGGFVAGSREVRELLLNRGRPYIYSTALPAPIVAAALAALDVTADGTLRATLHGHLRALNARLGTAHPGPIVPIVLGSEAAALHAAEQLVANGLFSPAIRPPTVPVGTSRLRITLSAAHSADVIENLGDVLLEALDVPALRDRDERAR